MAMQEETPTNKYKGTNRPSKAAGTPVPRRSFTRRPSLSSRSARSNLGVWARRYRSWSPLLDTFYSDHSTQTRVADGRLGVALRGSGVSGLGTSAHLSKVQLRRK